MDTIKSSKEISQLFLSGSRLKNRYITFIVAERFPSSHHEDFVQHGHEGRVAFIAGKRSGNAVWRNSAKRRMREVCRALGGPWKGVDVVLLAKPSLMTVPYSKVLRSCEQTVHDLESLITESLDE